MSILLEFLKGFKLKLNIFYCFRPLYKFRIDVILDKT